MAWITSKENEHPNPLVRLHVTCGFASGEAAEELIDSIVDTLSDDDLLDVSDLVPVGDSSFQDEDGELHEGEVAAVILAKLWRSSLDPVDPDASEHFRDDEAHVSHVLSELAPHLAVPGVLSIDVEVAPVRETTSV